MFSRFTVLAVVIASLISNSAAQAEPINYNFVEAGYVYLNPDADELDDGHGVQSLVSWSPVANFFLEGGYQYLHVGLEGPADIDENAFKYGGGAYYPLMQELHLVGHVGGISVNEHINDTDGLHVEGDKSSTETGVYVGANLRYEVLKSLELEPGIQYTHIDDEDSWFYEFKTLYALNESWQLSGAAGISDDSDVELVGGVRFNWGCAEHK